MDEDILNYLPTVMFRGTPCSFCQFSITNICYYQKNLKILVPPPPLSDDDTPQSIGKKKVKNYLFMKYNKNIQN